MTENRDRRTRMIDSSVNAPAKKDGYGGSYTWGGAMDVIDYEPKGVTIQKVSTVAAPTVVQQTMAAPAVTSLPVAISDASAFPALGSVTISPPTVTKWGPPVSSSTVVASSTGVAATTTTATMVAAAPAVQVGTLSAVPRAPDFDQQHPRNAFATKPRAAPRVETVVEAPLAVDWSSSGTVAVGTQVMKANANPAHLSQYTVAAPQPSLQQLKATQISSYVDKKQVKQQYSSKPALRASPGLIQQPQGRR